MVKSLTKVRYVLTAMLFSLSLLVMNPMVTYARADKPNAVADIMNDQRFVGAIESIDWLTKRIDHWFTMFITATAFFIISSALLKNACAGAYCANHKFWDKVAEAHERNEAATIQSVIQGVRGIPQMSASGFKDVILCIVPNIKAFTDFDDADIEPRQYFMKAIPQMLGCIMIGVFIYNGYYRDTAAMVGAMGSEICVRVFASVTPSKLLDTLTQTSKTPPNIFANDPTLQGKDMYQLSTEIYKTCLSSSKKMDSYDDKEQLMRNSEVIAQEILQHSNLGNIYSSGRKYDYSISNVQVTIVGNKNDTNPSCKAVDKAKTKYSVVTYRKGPAPFFSKTDGPNCLYIAFTMVGEAKTRNTSVFSDIVAQAGSGEGLTTTNAQDTYRINVESVSAFQPGIIAMEGNAKSDMYDMTKLDVDAQQLASLVSQATHGCDIAQLMQKVLDHYRLSNVKVIKPQGTITINGGNIQGNRFDGKIMLGEPISVTINVNYEYEDDNNDDPDTYKQSGSMEYTMNIVLGTGGANEFPELLPAKYMPQSNSEDANSAITGAQQ